jgi:hypothetical protein
MDRVIGCILLVWLVLGFGWITRARLERWIDRGLRFVSATSATPAPVAAAAAEPRTEVSLVVDELRHVVEEVRQGHVQERADARRVLTDCLQLVAFERAAFDALQREGERERREHEAEIRVARAAREIKERRGATTQRPPPAPEPIPNEPAEDRPSMSDEETRVFGAFPPFTTELEAEAGGAPRSPQATPRAALSVAVAPPASAPELPPNAAIVAAGLGRPKSSRAPHAPPVRMRAATLSGMPAALIAGDTLERTSWPGLGPGHGLGASSRPPTLDEPPAVAIPRFPATMTSMPAQAAPSSRASSTVATKEICKRCNRRGAVQESGQGIIPCPDCTGTGLVDTASRALCEAS